MLPTILFILAAYGVYALVVAWCRRQSHRFEGTRAKARPRWVTLAGGAVILGVTLWLIFWLAPASQDQKVRLAAILGMTEGEARLVSQAAPQKPIPSLKQQQSGGQPAYALLHPESPPSLLPPAKPPTGTQVRKLKGKRASTFQPLKAHPGTKVVHKEKASNKVKVKKKKTSRGSARPSKSSRDSTG